MREANAGDTCPSSRSGVPSQLLQLHGTRTTPTHPLQYLIASLYQDCGDVIASTFFPTESPDGKQHPLCERDYFRRLNLICAKCGMGLRGSYITACSTSKYIHPPIVPRIKLALFQTRSITWNTSLALYAPLYLDRTTPTMNTMGTSTATTTTQRGLHPSVPGVARRS